MTNLDLINAKILKDRLDLFNARPGPRVGDFVKMPACGVNPAKYERLTYDWQKSIQAGGMAGSYYLSVVGCLSYSGSLNNGFKPEDLIPTDEQKPGALWFFDSDLWGAGRGITCYAPMRVFALREGADLSGIW